MAGRPRAERLGGSILGCRGTAAVGRPSLAGPPRVNRETIRYVELLDKSDQDLVDVLSQDFNMVGRDSETPRAVIDVGSVV